MDSRRQEKFAKQIQKDLGNIFLIKKNTWFEGVFISISNVSVSPDLGYVKVYLSFLQEIDKKKFMEIIELHNKEIRKELANLIKNQVRKIPELIFFLDDSMDYVLKMEKVFKDLKKDDTTEE